MSGIRKKRRLEIGQTITGVYFRFKPKIHTIYIYIFFMEKCSVAEKVDVMMWQTQAKLKQKVGRELKIIYCLTEILKKSWNGSKNGNSCFKFYVPVPPTLVTPVQKILNSSETFSFIFHQGFCGKEHIYWKKFGTHGKVLDV